jgi:cytochrome c-type biogenesis protein CcmE
VDPRRKRTIRLVVALSAALVLAGALAYTSFSASREERSPRDLVAMAQAGTSYRLVGKVVNGSIRRAGDGIAFRVRDRSDAVSVPVRYSGEVPDPFRDGRDVILTVRRRGGVFQGESGSLVTKCPSKFKAAPPKA